MCPQIRIADGLRTQSAKRLITTAGAIINGLTGNSSFPLPSVDLNTVQAKTWTPTVSTVCSIFDGCPLTCLLLRSGLNQPGASPDPAKVAAAYSGSPITVRAASGLFYAYLVT